MIRPGRDARRAAARLCLVDFSGLEPPVRLERLIADDHVGGVCLFRKNVASARQVSGLATSLQRIAREAGAPPVWVTIDHEGGAVNRFLDAPVGGRPAVTPLPSAMALGAAGDPGLARAAGRVAGAELRAMGIHLNYAPVMDVNNNAANPVIGARAFGDTPAFVETMGLAYVEGLQAAGVGATVKHFPGHGDVTVDSHVALPLVNHPVDRLDAVELRPFRAAVRDGVAAVMTAHIVFPALDPDRAPATMSRPILGGLLRDEWGFQGLLISDSLAMGAIVDNYGAGDAAVASVQAGCDLLLALGPDDWQDEMLDRLAVAIEEGRIPPGRLAATADRVAGEGHRWGVGDELLPGALELVGSEEHAGIARRIAESAVTVVRDRAGALPVRGERVGVVTLAAGAGDCQAPSLVPLLRRHHPNVQPAFIDGGDGAEDCIIAVTCSRGISPSEQAGAVRDLHRHVGDRLVVVATGDPYDLLQFPEIPTYVLSYGSEEMSLDATARVLAGVAPPRGRLPVTLPGLHDRGEGIVR